MLEDRCNDIEELSRWIASMPSDGLFRGQRNHFTENGKANITNSFERHGCVPLVLFKWSYYVKEVIRLLGGATHNEISTEITQALLQHYGWRSFYVDLTSDFSVAAWFASHTFKLNSLVTLWEDCFEDPTLLIHQNANYDSGEGDGHVYVFSRSVLMEREIGVFDLSVMKPQDFIARHAKQQAFLIGPLKGRVPPDLIYAHLICPSSVLNQAAVLAGYDKTEDLFPTREQDSILQSLLSVPWRLFDDNSPPIFIRGLSLPEFDYQHSKFIPDQHAFYRPFWIADDRGGNQLPFEKSTFVRVPEEIFYSFPRPDDQKLEKVSAFIREKGSIAIETDGIMRLLEFPNDCYYVKGVFINMTDDQLVQISSILIEHPGMQVAGVIVTLPWTYQITEECTWLRVMGAQDCRCNNHQRHFHNFWIVGALEYVLSDGHFVERNSLDLEWQDPYKSQK